jgi:glycosyltransferase involved in cell wall biosynthesis
VTETRNATIYYGGFAFRGGGAFLHAQLLRTELRRAGWGVELITLESLPLPLRYLPHIVGWALNWFIPPMGFYYKDRLTRFLYKRLFDRDAQLRIFEDVYLAWNSPVPSVTLLHAVRSDNLQSISAEATAVMHLVKAEERVIDLIAHPIITVSDRYRDFLVGSHGGSCRLPDVAVVPLGLDLAEFDIAGQAQHSAKSLVFCGSLEPRKNLRFLLGVFRQLHQADGGYRLTIIGDGPDQIDLERYALQHALPVAFRGRLGREDVIKELRLHSVYVHPSVKESFSFALLEGKMAGLKTVAYKGLEVPVEFVDVPVASFDAADWLAAIMSADDAVSKEIEVDIYSSRRMMLDTLDLAFGAVEGTS